MFLLKGKPKPLYRVICVQGKAAKHSGREEMPRGLSAVVMVVPIVPVMPIAAVIASVVAALFAGSVFTIITPRVDEGVQS